jgi:hypothetical protein
VITESLAKKIIFWARNPANVLDLGPDLAITAKATLQKKNILI